MTVDEKLAQFVEDLHRDVRARAEGGPDGAADEAVFTEMMIEFLEEFGEADDLSSSHYEAKGLKVSGYGISEDNTTLDLLVSDCDWKSPPESFTQTRLQHAVKRARNFFSQASKGLHEKMEESGPAYDMVEHVHHLADSITKVRIFVLTDAVAKNASIPDEEVDGVYFTHHVWDAERLFRCETSGKKREPIVVEFDNLGGPLPVLSHEESKTYSAYLAIVPGQVLAKLYEKWGSRLLERNVRTFLQARGKVNRGIRDTIKDSPEMFFTYNNGISTTAEKAEIVHLDESQQGIARLEDFQIVNGGQTTASIFNTYWKEKADLSKVKVAMKLTVVKKPELMDQVVRAISRYSNTQNNVSTADFESNDPFHRQIEEFSRTIWAPDPEGGKAQTRWYYERARGQYNDERARQGTRARIHAWEAIHPPRQKFTKTDLAKYEHAWHQRPDLVSLGAQKNFAHFSVELKEDKTPLPDEDYFRDLVAKAILFRRADLTIARMELGGYKAQVTAYAVAWLSHLTAQRIDLDETWQAQDLAPPFYKEIERLAKKVYQYLSKPPGGRNVTEWCKDLECWKGLLKLDHELGSEVADHLLKRGTHQRSMVKSVEAAEKEQHAYVVKASKVEAETWLEMSNWARLTKNLESWQRSIVYGVGKRLEQGRPVSWKQARQALIAYEEAMKRGFKPEKAGR